jgi:hypothetical protein
MHQYKEEWVMSQLYLHCYKYRGGIKSEYDKAWAVANEVMAKCGNYGEVESGLRQLKNYGTGRGGYCILEVTDPAAFARYQHFIMLNYAHVCEMTFEPIYDMETVST